MLLFMKTWEPDFFKSLGVIFSIEMPTLLGICIRPTNDIERGKEMLILDVGLGFAYFGVHLSVGDLPACDCPECVEAKRIREENARDEGDG